MFQPYVDRGPQACGPASTQGICINSCTPAARQRRVCRRVCAGAVDVHLLMKVEVERPVNHRIQVKERVRSGFLCANLITFRNQVVVDCHSRTIRQHTSKMYRRWP